jgi:hypothetical protein
LLSAIGDYYGSRTICATLVQPRGVIVLSHRRRTIDAVQPNSARTLRMNTLPIYNEARALPKWYVSAGKRRELQSQELSTLLTKYREITDEEFELIEMRYQLLLARMNLEDLFAEAQLGCT